MIKLGKASKLTKGNGELPIEQGVESFR